jgi:hypothetical protein
MPLTTASSTRAKHRSSEPTKAGQDALVASFRAELAGRRSPLDEIPAAELEQARSEFRDLPEVAGEPLPASKRRSSKR